ncbi:LLM class flavin-dependent oxidoreductase [Sinobaca qinghaiensis]|nr:LLM class flavin-dependent oxidoreductase [Sinobaca qinghaiensis]
MMKLGVLDQSPVIEGKTHAEALQDTVALAEEADRLGLSRFWVSEHHAAPNLAGASPEVLIPHIASRTKNIKVGSGGIMLSHYSAFKTAENFSVLENLYPGRIDLGIGRAPGGMPLATMALHDRRKRDTHRYPEQVKDLIGYLHHSLPEDHFFKDLCVTPQTESPPEIWMLGSSASSASLAAEYGMPYCYAHFINAEDGEEATRLYREHFKPSAFLKKPKVITAVFAASAPTVEEAEEMGRVMDHVLLSGEQGKPLSGIPSFESIASVTYESYEQKRIDYNRARMAVGTPEETVSALMNIGNRYLAEEVMVVSLAPASSQKINSLRLIADAFS